MSMKPRSLISGLAIGICAGGGVAGCEMEPVPNPTGPEALIEAWETMWNTYDLDQVGALFLDDGRLTYFSSEEEGVIRGMDAVLEHHVGFGFVSGGKDQPNRLWLEDLSTDLFGDVAVVTGIWFFASGEGDTDPALPEGVVPTPQRGPVTFVCVNKDDGWRFVHMSFSEYLPATEG